MTEPKLEVPAELRELAEKTIDQAEKAFGMFFDAAGKSMTSMPGAGTEISKQALSFTEQNMKAAFEHARKLVHATDLQEAMRIQSEFLRSQFTNAGEHMRQITGGVMSGASRVIALIVASGIPGRRAAVIASLRRPAAACSASDTSVRVRDTSVAVSMARSAMPGCEGSGVSIFTFCNSLGRSAFAEQQPMPRQYAARKFGPGSYSPSA